MKTLLILLTGLAFVYCSNTKHLDESKIIRLMNSYNDAFIKADYKSIVEHFTFPISLHLDQKTINIKKKCKLKLLYKKTRGALPDIYSYSKWEKISLKILSERIAIVNTIYSRYDKNNRIFNSGSALYSLRKLDEEWKICSLTSYEFSNYFDLYKH